MLVNKRKKIWLASLVGLTSPLAFAISCGNKNNDSNWFDKFHGFKTLIANYAYPNIIVKAKVTKWKDGDTIDFEKYEASTKQWVARENGRKLTLRINAIDTPEYHVPNATDQAGRGDLTDKEIAWAKKATDWAKKEIPVGTEIRIWKTSTDGYGRIVGNIFYNKPSQNGFNDNFAINIIRAGYTLPRVGNKGTLLLSLGDDGEIYNYLALPLYYAWKEAQAKKVNLYGLSQAKLEKVYKKHGIPSNELAIVKKHEKEWINDETFKRYKIYG